MTAKSLRHRFQSTVPDEADASLVRPSNWNDDHDLWVGFREVLAPATADTLLATDHLSWLSYNSDAGVAVTLPALLGNRLGWKCRLLNIGEGEVTLVPETTINGETAAFTLSRGEMLEVFATGTTDFRAVRISVGFEGGASAQSVGGLLSCVSPTRLLFHRFVGGSIVHDARIWPIPRDGLEIPNTNVSIDGTLGNLEPDTTYYLFVTDDGDELVPNFIQVGPVDHAQSESPGNEGVEVLRRGDPLWDHVRFLIGNDNAPNGTTTYLEQRFGTPIGFTANIPANQPIYSNQDPPPGMQTSIRFPAGVALNVGANLNVPASPNLTIGTQDFCLEGFFRREGNSVWLCNRGTAVASRWGIHTNATAAPGSIMFVAGALGLTAIQMGRTHELQSPASPAWNYFNICRYGGERLYGNVNGSVRRISNSAANLDAGVVGNAFNIGAYEAVVGTNTSGLQGGIASWRLTIGNARYPEPDFIDLNVARTDDITRVPMPFPVGPATLDDTQTLIGLVRTDASGQFVDNERQRFVASWFNRRPRQLRGRASTNSFASTAVTELSPVRRIECVTWEGAINCASVGFAARPVVGGWSGGMTITVDAPNNALFLVLSLAYDGAGWGNNMSSGGTAYLSEGYHWLTQAASTNATANFIGSVSAELNI